MRGHARVVDLHDEAGIDNRLVFDAHRLAQRREIFLIGGVVAVLVIELEIGRRDGGHEGVFDLDVLERRLEIVDVGLQLVVADIFDRAGADLRARTHRALGHQRAGARRQHRAHVFIGLREGGRVARGPAEARRAVDLLEPAQPRAGIGHPVDFAVLAVVDDVDADLRLPPHDVGDGLPHTRFANAAGS